MRDLRERLIGYYRGRDYLLFDAAVTVEEPVAGRTPIIVSIVEGKRGYIKDVRFSGNRGLSEKVLRGQMTTKGRGVFHWITNSGHYSDEEWNDDMNAIVGLYQKSGYARMKILGIDDVWDDQGGIVKTIRLEEGPRYRVREIVFQGNDHFLRSEFPARIRNKEGAYLDYVGAEADQEAVAAHYRDAGYLDVRVESEVLFDADDTSSVLRFVIVEGPRYRLGNIVVRGTLLTRAAAILRENPIAPGGTAGEKDLLRFQQAVYGTGLYKSVRVQRVKRPEEGILDLVFEVEEALFFEVEFGGGWGTDTGFRGLLGAKEKNLDGLGRSVSAQAIVSQKEEKLIGDLREPWIFGNRWKWEGGLTGLYDKAERISFNLRKASVVASITRKLLERSSVSLQYELSRDEVSNVAPGAVLSPKTRDTPPSPRSARWRCSISATTRSTRRRGPSFPGRRSWRRCRWAPGGLLQAVGPEQLLLSPCSGTARSFSPAGPAWPVPSGARRRCRSRNGSSSEGGPPFAASRRTRWGPRRRTERPPAAT